MTTHDLPIFSVLGRQKLAKKTEIGKCRLRSLIKLEYFLSILKFWIFESDITDSYSFLSNPNFRTHNADAEIWRKG